MFSFARRQCGKIGKVFVTLQNLANHQSFFLVLVILCSMMFWWKIWSFHKESLMSNHDLHVYSRNLMPTLGSLCFNFLMLTQSSREVEGENINENTNIRGIIYASLKGQPLLLSVSHDPSSAHEINKCRYTILYKIINKGEIRESLFMQRSEESNFVEVLSRHAGSR